MAHLIAGEYGAGFRCRITFGFDPGFTIVREAIHNEIPVSVIPGPTAVIAALTLSGLLCSFVHFRGFPPRKSSPQRFFEVDLLSPHTLIYYESPYRLVASLTDALTVFGERETAVANDLTKKFERVDRGTLSNLIDHFTHETPRGEYTVVISGLIDKRREKSAEPFDILGLHI